MSDEQPLGVTIGGRRYVEVGRGVSFASDRYVIGYIGLTGMADVFAGRAVMDPETAGQIGYRLLISPYYPNLLAGLLVAEGETWTRQAADKLAQAIDANADPVENLTMQVQFMGLLSRFFGSGGASPTTSPTSSDAAPAKSMSTEPSSSEPTPSESSAPIEGAAI